MKVCTKTGDNCLTTSPRGVRVNKNSGIINVVGDIDELSSCLGFATQLACEDFSEERHDLVSFQRLLFELAASFSLYKEPHLKKIKENLAEIDAKIEQLEKKVDLPESFILTGCKGKAGMLSSYLHVCRAVCRRLERSMTALYMSEDDKPEDVMLVLVNRLSDLLYLMAINTNNNKKEEII